jgi:hypothetical protein
MRYQPGSAITGAIKLKTTTKLQPVIEEAPEPPEVQSAVRQPCQSRFIAAPATLGYSVTADSPANVPTPFGLFPDVSLSTVLSTLATDTQQGITAFENDLADSAALLASLESSGQSFTDLLSALSLDAADPAATVTDLVNAISSAASTAYSTLLPLADIGNALLTSIPSYDLSLFTDNLSSGDLLDALGLPIAANTGLDTLFAGFGFAVIDNAASQISADFSGLF